MKCRVLLSCAGLALLLALAGCGHGLWQYGERAQWRHEAELTCLKSGAVKLGAGAVQIQPIEGPGVCGADFPLKVTGLGESGTPMAYADDLRPPAAIPNGAGPRWPVHESGYTPPATVPQGTRMQWMTGPQGISQEPGAGPQSEPGAPMSITPPGTGAPSARPDDIPDDAILPPETQSPRRSQPVNYQPPPQQQPMRTIPPLGPSRIAAATPVTLTPSATLACPIVSALDRWVSEGVQPAALHWFGQPVTQIKQISAYSCREMVGAGGHGISEHAFGNALDVAGFTLADGRTISVVKGWHGTPEEQGFLHDVQLYACETFTTVLAPGYNAAHYNHIHVDLMHRRPGYRPCRPTAERGEIVAARVRAHYASRHGAPAYTGSVDTIGAMIAAAKAGEDGLADEDDADAAPAPPSAKKASLFDFSRFNLFGKSSLEDATGAKAAQ